MVQIIHWLVILSLLVRTAGKETKEVRAVLQNNLNTTIEIQWPDPQGAFTDIHLIAAIPPFDSAQIDSL